MQPLHHLLTRGAGGRPDTTGGDAAAAPLRVDHGVEEESVHAAVPGEVDVAHQALTVIGAEMREAAGPDGAGIACERHSPDVLPERRELRRRRIRVLPD